MAKDGAQGNGGDDPVDDLFDAIQTVHDRRVREETQTALLRTPTSSPKPEIRLTWLLSVGAAILVFLTVAGWLFTRFKGQVETDSKTPSAARSSPSPTAEPWAERSSPIPAYQPSQGAPIAVPAAAPVAPPPPVESVKHYQEEVHPSDVRPDVRQRQVVDPDEAEGDDEAPKPQRSGQVPPGESESESFFE